MTTDISRKSFDHTKNYSGLICEQGRVQLDSEWNEATAITDRRWRAETLDVFGRCRVSRETPDAFLIAIDGGDLTIGPGRMYVDGLLTENHGSPPDRFDPILAELTGVAEIPFDLQPFNFEPNINDLDDGRYLVYLDVWYRDVDYVKAPELVELAIGIPTTSRIQTVWQVKVHDEVLRRNTICFTPDVRIPGWVNLTRPSDGRLSTEAIGVASNEDPCILPPGGGYRGLENRTYRVEVHNVDDDGNATFKWSRHNATIVGAVNAIPSLDKLELESLGRDSVLSFNNGDWVEIIDDALELAGKPGIIRRIVVDAATNTITLNDPLPENVFPKVGTDERLDEKRHTRVYRWDQSGDVRDTDGNSIVDLDAIDADGVVPVPAPGTSIVLEDGVQITFDVARPGGTYRAGDYWIFVARTTDASVEELDSEPPCGIHHHYCRLAIVEVANREFVSQTDCRERTPDDPASATGCCTVVVRPGDDIQDAIDSLPAEGGCVCLKPGLHELEETLRIENSNVELHGETKGVVVRRLNDATALLVENPAGLFITGISIAKIQFEFENSDIDGSALAPMLGLDQCDDVVVEDCRFSIQRAEPLIGLRINGCLKLRLERCEFDSVVFGVWVIGDSTALSVRDNVFRCSNADGSDGGSVCIFLQDAFGASRIVGNEIVGYLFGISLNRNTLNADIAPTSGATGSIIAENRISRFFAPIDSSERKAFAIDVAASNCMINDNEISYSSHVYGGINVTGGQCNIENNRLRFRSNELVLQPAIGILLGVADNEALRIVEGGQIIGNRISGPQNAIVVFRSTGVRISDNQINSADDQVGFGVVLIEVDHAIVTRNRIGNSMFAVAASDGKNNSFVYNHLENGGAAMTAMRQTAIEFAQNRIENMRNWGLIGLQLIDKVAIAENRVTSCGYQESPAIGIGVSSVFGELAIGSCEITDTGVSPDKSIISQPAWQIIGDLVLECRIQGNLVTYSNTRLLATNLEDRALWLRGLIDSQVPPGNADTILGFSAQVLDNKFSGPGFSSLVEFQQLQQNNNVFVRFERVFFNNNFCWHVSTEPDSDRATVRLAGRSVIVMGNHIRAATRFPSVDFQEIPGVFVGNITQGGTLNFDEFPIPETNFNRM